MTDHDYITLASFHDPQKEERMRLQANRLWASGHVVCSCSRLLHFTESFRCLYCGEYFCGPCAERHFGKTVRDWLGEKHPESLRRFDCVEMAKYCKPVLK